MVPAPIGGLCLEQPTNWKGLPLLCTSSSRRLFIISLNNWLFCLIVNFGSKKNGWWFFYMENFFKYNSQLILVGKNTIDTISSRFSGIPWYMSSFSKRLVNNWLISVFLIFQQIFYFPSQNIVLSNYFFWNFHHLKKYIICAKTTIELK